MSAKLLGRVTRSIGLVAWVSVGFIGAQYAVSSVYALLAQAWPSITNTTTVVAITMLATAAYVSAVLVVVYLPRLLKHTTNKEELGLSRIVEWKDFGAALISVVPYFILSGALAALLALVWSGFNENQKQEILFSGFSQQYEVVLGFITLVVIAPLAEELLFRGYLLGKLRKSVHPVWAVVITALVFGAMHLPAKSLQWGVAADTFALGLVLGSLRLYTGAIWAGVMLHALKNSVAFYVLFINPSILGML